ncbi:MAG: putative quorum-sensing-regulated virulence factor, partial [Oceanisphaera sp.]
MSLASSELLDIISKPMPFGKYSGRPLLKLPMAYLCWFERKGWPSAELGAEQGGSILCLIFSQRITLL